MNPTSMPPHSVEAERAVLGGLLLSSGHMHSVLFDERLVAADFYVVAYGTVFSAAVALFEEGAPIDSLTVDARMREIGGPLPDEPLEGLAAYVPVAGNVRAYARRVRELSLRRQLLAQAQETAANVMSGHGTARELIEQTETRMLHVSDAVASELSTIKTDEELARLALVRDGVAVVGVPSGFMDLDNLTSGFQPGNLIVLAARPSMGKTSFALNMAENAAAKGKVVALFSLEMSRSEVVRRILASQSRVSGGSLLRGPIPQHHWDRILKSAHELGGWPLFVDDAAEASVLDIRAKVRRLAQRQQLALVIVDYLQLMTGDLGAENRNVEVGRISRGLKLLAKELDVPVVVVSQLSRQVEHRQDKHPQLSDLRESGAVEQDADVVMFLFREAYYNPDVEDPAVSELIVAKQRNGPLGKVLLTFLDTYPRFSSFVRMDEPVHTAPF